MNITERRNILITCGPGLKDFLIKEVEDLEYPIVDSHSGGVVTKGSFVDCMQLSMHLRTAYNVLYLMKEFRCGSDTALYKQVNSLAWENIIDSSGYFTVVSQVDTWSIDNSMYPNLKVKDAIVDRIQRKTGSRPDSGSERNKTVVNLFWKNDKAWIYLNMSGLKLSDRNYRKIPHKAPLRESLAAGILLATGYDGSQDLVLPMCGSGTLAIEAAMIAMNKPPALLRSNFGFTHLKCFDESIWKDIRIKAKKQGQMKQLPHSIIATDLDKEAIIAAKQNAKTAGVDHLIQFSVCDFSRTPLPDASSIILMNPEYGLRLGDLDDLELHYKRIGDYLKQKCSGHTGYVFTGNMELAKKIGLKTSQKYPFYNGNIDCRLLKYELYSGTKKS